MEQTTQVLVGTEALEAADQMAALLGQATRRPPVPLRDRMAAPGEAQPGRVEGAEERALLEQMLEAALSLLAVLVALALHLLLAAHQ